MRVVPTHGGMVICALVLGTCLDTFMCAFAVGGAAVRGAHAYLCMCVSV